MSQTDWRKTEPSEKGSVLETIFEENNEVQNWVPAKLMILPSMMVKGEYVWWERVGLWGLWSW